MVLNDICEFIVDCPHSTAPNEGEGYPIIRTPNVGRGRLILMEFSGYLKLHMIKEI